MSPGMRVVVIEGRAAMGDRDRDGRRPWWRAWVSWVAVGVVTWVACSLVMVVTSVRAYSIPTSSMAPTLKAGDRVGVRIDRSHLPRRGEVWVFRMPPASRKVPNQAVKRIIGLPGETVEVVSGRVLIDGTPLEEPYGPGPIGYTMPPLTLGPGQYFVLGDNRNASFDSHAWGPVPADHLIGPVQVRYWPPGRVGGL
jgi:signal peptidase I